jgi:hypothetical protein
VEAVEGLHTAARRYCEERSGELWSRADSGGYRLLEAMRAAIEAFVPTDLGSLGEARELLAATAATAESDWTKREPERASMDAERALLSDYVRTLGAEALAGVEPLPFRRTLIASESSELWSALERHWGVKLGRWYPLDRERAAAAPEHTVVFSDAAFDDAEIRQTLRDALAQIGAPRVLELREYDEDTENKEIELSLLLPYCVSGGEGFWLDRSFAWLIYASHEESVTVGGRELLMALQAAWPAWRDSLYKFPA